MKRYAAVLFLAVSMCGLAFGNGTPAGPQKALYQPCFITASDTREAGVGFFVVYANRFVLVTPRSAMPVKGADTGSQQSAVAKVWAAQLPERSEKLEVAEPAGAKSEATASENMHRFVFFVLTDTAHKPTALKLATKGAAADDRVNVFTWSRDDRQLRLLPARVIRATADRMSLLFVDPSMAARNLAGSPVLNAQGEVVGVCTTETVRPGRGHFYADPSVAVAKSLMESVR